MKKISMHIPFAVLMMICIGAAGMITSCQKKAELPVVTEWELYQDPVSGLEVKYPKGWLLNAGPKRIKIYSSQVVADKFFEVYSQGSTTVNSEQGGIEIEITSESFADVNAGTLEEFKGVTMKSFSALNLAGEQPATVGGQTAAQYSFKVKVGKETVMQGEKIIAAYDSAFYTVGLTGFNDYFEVYKPLLNEISASIKLPKPKISYKDPNAAALPSADVSTFSNDFVEFSYPYNFEVTMPKAKKDGPIHSLHIEGLRKDCTIDLDVFPTKTDKGIVKFDKFVEDNKVKFKPKSTTAAKIDGADGKLVVAAPPAANIERAVYFVSKGDRIYQVVLTWYKPLTNDFKPAFDKVVASLKLK